MSENNDTVYSTIRDWKNLDRDVLINIYKFLCCKDLVKGAPLCCTSWYSASRESCLWQIVNLGRRGPGEGCNDWWKYTEPINVILEFVMNRSQGLLTQLKFPLFSSVHDLLYVTRRCSNLTYIDINIRQCKKKLVEEKKVFELSLSQLRMLEGMGVDEIFISDGYILEQINQWCPNFKKLKVYLHEEDDFLSKKTVSLIITYGPKLKELYLSETGLDRQSVLLFLNTCNELEVFDITCNGKINIEDEILQLGSRLKQFFWDDEVQDVCYDCQGDHLEQDVEETYHYRWPCRHVVDEGFQTYITGTEEYLINLHPNSSGTFEKLVGNLYPNARGAFIYPSPPLDPFVYNIYDLPTHEYQEHYDCYCDCGFNLDFDDSTFDAAAIAEAYSL